MRKTPLPRPGTRAERRRPATAVRRHRRSSCRRPRGGEGGRASRRRRGCVPARPSRSSRHAIGTRPSHRCKLLAASGSAPAVRNWVPCSLVRPTVGRAAPSSRPSSASPRATVRTAHSSPFGARRVGRKPAATSNSGQARSRCPDRCAPISSSGGPPQRLPRCTPRRHPRPAGPPSNTGRGYRLVSLRLWQSCPRRSARR
mmetsp:Transcript_86058/g.277979  ORF Transcript_86058/g.277979 Transcript_86058/m.277979 type:complete len:200 (-) Transcript_86058:2941-3540(-)